MFARSLIVLAVCGGLALVVLSPAQGGTEQDARVFNSAEVLARGPVHETYAQPADGSPQPGPVVPREPPKSIEEQPPDQKPDGAVWVSGYWQWDEERSDFIWISGFWRVPPPGRQWVPGSYRQGDNGFQWSPGMWLSQNQQPNLVPPPPPSVENGPAQPAPADDSIYVPGSWMYRQERYLWRPGYWMGFRPDMVWFPAQYYWTPAGCVFVDGYWDYPLAGRGLLFAPVSFGGGIWNQPGFFYTPSYVVGVNFLPTALFVRPRFGHYYFGDYFGGGFARAGFTPWINYSWRPGVFDPLYAQARFGNGPGWQRNLATLYANRAAGQVGLPRTLAQQNALVQNRTSVNNVRVLTPLNQAAADQGLRLTALNQAQRQQFQRSGQQLRESGNQRREQLLTSRSAPRNLNLPHSTPLVPPAGSGVSRQSSGREGTAVPQRVPVHTPVKTGPGPNVPSGGSHGGGAHAPPRHHAASPVHVAPSVHTPAAVVPHQLSHAAPPAHSPHPVQPAPPSHSSRPTPAHHSSASKRPSGHGHR